MQSICVFCGSHRGNRLSYQAAAIQLGTRLAEQGTTLVYGGGNVGLMGEVANAALKAGGKVIGVVPEGLATKEIAHHGLTELHIVKTMHQRKALMAEKSEGFIALPGGLGTFEEFFEILTWTQLGIHHKPCGLLNVDGYYAPLIAMIEHAIREGFILPANAGLMVSDSEITGLLNKMREWKAPHSINWISKKES